MRSWLVAWGVAALLVPAAKAATGPNPAVMTAMLQFYGRYDPPHQCWHATAGSGDTEVQTCLAVVGSDEVTAPEGKRRYLVLEGRDERGCRDCGGVIAFVVFGGADGLRVLAHSPAMPDGRDGEPTDPKRVRFQKLGASQWGWIEETGSTGNERDDVVWLPRTDRVVAVARLPQSGGGGKGLAECSSGAGGPDCDDVTITYRVDARDPAAPYYPILLQETATKDRHRVSGQAVARFNLANYSYQVAPGPP